MSSVPLRPRCRKSGSVLGLRTPDHRLTSVGLPARGSGRLWKGLGRQPPVSSPPSEACSRRSRALIRPSGLTCGIGAQPFGGRGPGAIGARPFGGPRLGTVQPALEGVDPDREPGGPVGQSLNRDAETRMLIERGLFGRVPSNALAAPIGGLRASPSFGGAGSTQSLSARGSFRLRVGIGARPFGARWPGAIGAQPFNGRGPQLPSGGIGAGGGRGGG